MAVSLDLRAPSDQVVLLDWSKVFWNEPNLGGPEWKAVLGAFGDYAGNTGLTNAAATFQQATNCYHWGRQTVGLALASASKAKLREREQARELLQQAEAKWRELDENNRPDRAWHWPELTLCELALEEARRQVGKSTVAASK